MASKFPEEREDKVPLQTRKGFDMAWSCDKHVEPISFYCRKHEVHICHKCATKDHGQMPCMLDDIEDVILEMRRNLEETRTKIAETKSRLERIDSKIETSASSASNHLHSVNDEVNTTYNGKLQCVKEKERDEIRLIHMEADEEIRIINEKREKRIKACKEEAEKQLGILRDTQDKLLSEITNIDKMVRKRMKELESKNQHAIIVTDKIDSKITRIQQDDKTLMTEVPRVIASLDEGLSSNFHQEDAEYLDRIEREVQRVKFVEGEVGGGHYGRIDGYGKWELVKSIPIPSIVNNPWVRSFISDDEIFVLDESDFAFYVTNIRTEHTKKVMNGGGSSMYVTSCAPIDSNVIVCGKGRSMCRGDSLDGCITMYDRQWKVIRDITIPRNTSSPYNTVNVDVDRDGMILAAQCGQPNIYAINPADSRIVKSITMQGKALFGEMQVLSSGEIVVRTSLHEFTVMSRSGEEKAVIHCNDWEWSCCSVDKVTDTLYVTYENKERNAYAVDQVSRDGNIQAKRIVEYLKSFHYFGQCLITPSGNLVACDGAKLLVYKKRFIMQAK